ncbi:3-mercaptopyruvate sulfurtransferase [Azospirillum halopraeferens]|uniref:3-mercaptopyruvate sulfurtransferase n=1 Tax=Azospirillum halopraeferens TaxID=34010 RepID=UPI0003F7BE8C|nr:3-mercaptopyruvate sulfurtransferase [Azospirillum halopraeferens]
MTTPTLPGALVSPAWLAEHLHHPRVRIVDATWAMPGTAATHPRDDFTEEHIPGAVFFDIDAIARPGTDPLPHMLPTPGDFAAKVGALGIGNDDVVVCYDTHGLQTAARAWWMFRVFGHDRVAVLDGGLPAWQAARLPVTGGPAKPEPKAFAAQFRPELVRSREQILANIAAKAETVIDARNQPRFEGTVDDPWKGRRRGHIPGSRNLPFTELLDPVTKTVQPLPVLKAAFERAGVEPGKPVAASCGSGVTACVLVLGLHLLGRTDVPVYDGSWAEWGLPGDTPTETGPAQP